MNQKRQTVQIRWLNTRQPSQRTGNEAVIFSDECWAGGLRLAASPAVHYELVMAAIRRTLIKKGPGRGLMHCPGVPVQKA